MDISKTYQGMCDCDEIRKEYKCIHDVGDGRETWDDKDFVKWKDNHMTWLPRQDQIQEMMGWKAVKLVEQLYHFLDKQISYSVTDYYSNSMEQLWLTFYMDEKHNKFWDGEKWAKKE